MFLFPDHEERFQYLLSKDKTNAKDVERIAMFYVFAGNDELVKKVEEFYDFNHQMIRTEKLKAVKLSSSVIALVKLAFNLYNNFEAGTVMDLFANLDEQNQQLALKAIQLRFNITLSDSTTIK